MTITWHFSRFFYFHFEVSKTPMGLSFSSLTFLPDTLWYNTGFLFFLSFWDDFEILLSFRKVPSFECKYKLILLLTSQRVKVVFLYMVIAGNSTNYPNDSPYLQFENCVTFLLNVDFFNLIFWLYKNSAFEWKDIKTVSLFR